MKIDSFEKLYAEQLADLYSAEGQLCDALPKMADAATDDELKMALQDHLEQTVVQRDRIEKLAGDSVSYRASAAAIFIGWTSVMILPWKSPETKTPIPLTSTMAAPVRTALRYIPLSSASAR